MGDDIQQFFQAFELFNEEKLIKGFLRVGRLTLVNAEKVLNSSSGFTQPIDVRFGKVMVKTGSHLLGLMGEILFGVADLKEISLLLMGPDTDETDGQGHRLVNQLSAEASGKMALLLGNVLPFHAHLYEFPSPELVREYFHWRQLHLDIYMLDRYFRHALLASGRDSEQVLQMAQSLQPEEKKEILKQHEIDYDSVPAWQRRGVGLYWKAGVGEEEPTLVVDTQLPSGEAYDEYLKRFL